MKRIHLWIHGAISPQFTPLMFSRSLRSKSRASFSMTFYKKSDFYRFGQKKGVICKRMTVDCEVTAHVSCAIKPRS